MAALTKARKTEPVIYTVRRLKMKADAVIYPGAIVCLDAGYAIPGVTDTDLVTKGIAAPHPELKAVYDNTGGASGAIDVVVLGPDAGAGGKQAFWVDNASAGNAVTQAEVGTSCYVFDDHTVTKTSTGRSIAGEVLAVDATKGVLVQI